MLQLTLQKFFRHSLFYFTFDKILSIITVFLKSFLYYNDMNCIHLFKLCMHHVHSLQPNGAEQLCSILNNFFTNLVDIIHDHGGDIIKFAGDALLIVWTVGIGPKAIPTFREAVLLATQCSTVIHEVIHFKFRQP